MAVTVEDKKKCTKCKKTKPLSEFTYRKKTKKHNNVCKDCHYKGKPKINWAKIAAFTEIGAILVAILVAIGSVIITVGIFSYDKCSQQEQDKKEYINQLEVLKHEQTLNHVKITKYIGEGKDSYLEGKETPVYRYIVGIINKLITEGKIRDEGLRNQAYNVAYIENRINEILDRTNTMFHEPGYYSHPESMKVFVSRVKANHQIIINLAEDLNEDIPTLLSTIEKEINKTNSTADFPLCSILLP